MNELKSLPVWVCWRHEVVDGRPTKLPYNPKTGGRAMSNKRETWATYKQAESAAPNFSGLGFMFADGICGIDIDDAVNDPERDAIAKAIIAHMDTYAELSPSGTGYHIIFKADISKLPADYKTLYFMKNAAVDIECYISGITNRYFTYSAEAVNNRDVEERTPQLLQFLDKYMKRPPQNGNSTGDKTKPDANQNVVDIPSIARRAKNGKKFAALFDAGDISAYNGDDSSADLALCNMLAFYCRGDAGEVDRLFRQSALMRDKWNRDDYRAATISKAIALCGGEYYRGRGRPKKARLADQPEETDAQGDKITIEGVATHLQSRGVTVRYNEINHTVDIDGIDAKYGLENLADMLPVIAYDELKRLYKSCPKDDVKDAISVIANINRYNPVVEMLEAARWDGRDRLPDVFSILKLTDADRLSKLLVYKWLWQCLSMARNDLQRAYGADGLLCLVGNQGIGKTSFLRKLAVRQEFFYEGQHLNFNDKDTSRRASSAWICELGEVESTLRSDIEKLKAYVTAGTDMYRLPYGRADVHLARRTSLCATANSDEYLIDQTGNRRFWTVPIDDIDLDALDRLDALQLWAQVDQQTKANRQGFRLTREEREQLDQRNNKHEKPMKAESEIRDIIEQAEQQGSNLTYKRVTVLAFKMAHLDAFRSYDVRQIGAALSKIGIEGEKSYIDGKQQRVRLLPMPRAFREPQ